MSKRAEGRGRRGTGETESILQTLNRPYPTNDASAQSRRPQMGGGPWPGLIGPGRSLPLALGAPLGGGGFGPFGWVGMLFMWIVPLGFLTLLVAGIVWLVRAVSGSPSAGPPAPLATGVCPACGRRLPRPAGSTAPTAASRWPEALFDPHPTLPLLGGGLREGVVRWFVCF